jgi:indole-3-glycerol phosphate synthase
MINILDKIIEQKRKETEQNKVLFPLALLEKSLHFEGTPVSMKKYLLKEDKTGIIAEFKRKSPSKGDINPYAKVERTTIGYMQSGASGLSVLTDETFFGGKNKDLIEARKFNFCPILRKDFIVDEYQIIEAKSIGADCILLIAAVLTTDEIKQFTKLAHSLGMEVLLEVHDKEELQKNLETDVDLIGVNNRNLKNMEVKIQNSLDLILEIPHEKIAISESGIRSVDDILILKSHGYKGFLMGEFFMTHSRPELACKEFVEELKKKAL